MIVNRPAIDYIRLTTFSQEDFIDISFRLVEYAKSKRIDKKRHGIMQYKGDIWGEIFMGQGEQKGTTHYMIDISGGMADDVWHIVSDCDSWKVTRIDVQLTVPKPSRYDARELLECLETGIWHGRRPALKAIINGGNDTLYMGSRTSGAYIRLYVKHSDWLRYEVEYKGDYAAQIFGDLKMSCDTYAPIANMLFERASRMPCSIPQIHFELIRMTQGQQPYRLQTTKVEPEKIKKMKWLASLLNSIQALANDHDYGHTVQQWLLDIVDNARENYEQEI